MHACRSTLEDPTYFLVGRSGDDLALYARGSAFEAVPQEAATTHAFVYTDRSIYRPDQKLHWKVVAYRGRHDRAEWKVLDGKEVVVILHDANGQQVAQAKARTNRHGSAAGELTVPSGKLLGAWTLGAQIGDTGVGGAGVRVEEYKRPTFEVSLREPDAALRLNRKATLVGEARYYFGLPVTSGEVRWRVTREPLWPWWWDAWGFAPRRGGGSARQTIAVGRSPVREDGTFSVEFMPAADEREARPALGEGAPSGGVTYRFRVEADLTDAGGETRSAERSVRLGFVAVESTIGIDEGFLRAGASGATARISRVSLDGAPRPGQGAWRLVRLDGPAKAALPADLPRGPEAIDGEGDDGAGAPGGPGRHRTDGDRLRPRWAPDFSPARELARWKDGAEVARGEATHGAKGEAAIALPKLEPGAYRLRYETKDDFGAAHESWREIVVADDRAPVPLAALLLVERGSVAVGGTARVLAHSGLDAQPLALELFRDGKVVDRRRVAGGPGARAVFDLPVREADRGGFVVRLWLVRDHQLAQLDQAVHVPWDDRELKVEIATLRDRLRPGAKETMRVKVTAPKGKPVEAGAAEVLAYMYDRSLDLFAPHAPPSVTSILPSRARAPWAQNSLGLGPSLWISDEGFARVRQAPGLRGDTLKLLERYGIGGPGMRFRRGMGHDAAMMEMAPAAAPAPPMETGALRLSKSAVAEDQDATAKSNLELAPSAPGAAQREAGGDRPVQVRTNFAETAFFRPQLLVDAKGEATIEFEVPDSVTAWNVWVHAVTRDLRGGSVRGETRSVKDLMVRPYLPRFLREGDRAVLKVVVNNASDEPLAGSLRLAIFDPDVDGGGEPKTRRSRLDDFQVKDAERAFTVAPGGSADVSFPLVAPRRPGAAAFEVIARAGDLSDGERRPLPLLPSRLHLAQSRFVTLRDKASRTMRFDDMAKTDDPSRVDEQLVVSLDAQLFYSVLAALPYLIEYPYECVEQTLNRFVSTGILSSLFRQFPHVAQMAANVAAGGAESRDTPRPPWEQADPNRKLALEETPWLVESRGGDGDRAVIKVLDPKVAAAQRDEAIGRLRRAQTAIGGFPWFPGGPPSPYMTLYLMYGFAKAAEFGVDVPPDMVQSGWQYLARHLREDLVPRMIEHDTGWETLTFLNYVASSYPDPSWVNAAVTDEERAKILAFSFRHWKDHSPQLKGMLALTLKRAGRDADARLVWDSVMDSAKTAEDQGTFWAPEERAWLWYNDTIETHAFALRTLAELDPSDRRRDGLVLWLFLNKKLNHWKSTRATAEVIYSLAHYLRKEQALGVREEARVAIGADERVFRFEPDAFAPKARVVVSGEALRPKEMSSITVSKETKGVMFASATWHFSTENLPAEARGDFFEVGRTYFRRDGSGKDVKLRRLEPGGAETAKLRPGDELEVHVSLRTKHAAEYVHLRDPRGAGFEPEAAVSRWRWDLGIAFYEEVRDSGTSFFFEQLPAGEYTFKYRVRAAMAGAFRVGPAQVQSMYAPEFNAYSAGHELVVE